MFGSDLGYGNWITELEIERVRDDHQRILGAVS